MMTFDDFFNKNNNQSIEKEDVTALDQCVDLIFAWGDYLGISRDAIRHQFAYQIYENPNDLTLQYFDYIPNTLNGIPWKGDVVVFGQGVGPSGHVSIATGKGDSNQFESFDQNWDTAHYFHKDENGNPVPYCRLVEHSYTNDNVLGWLRPLILYPDTCPKDRDINWNLCIQTFAALKVPLDSNNKEGSLQGALRAIADLEAAQTPSMTPQPPSPTVPPTVVDYKDYLVTIKGELNGTRHWYNELLPDPRLSDIAATVTESGV